MKTMMLVLAVVCGASLLVAGHEADSNSNVESKIRALEYKWAEAQGRKDNVALDALFDDDLIFVDYDGTLLTKAEYLTKVHMAGPALLEVVVESMAVHTFGTTVIVVGIYREKGVENGQVYVQRRRFLNTWEYKTGKWVCIAASAQPMQR